MGDLPGLGAFWLMCGSAFQATAHDEAPDAFMTLPAYARIREGEAPQMSCGPPSCRVGLCVRKGPHVITLVGTGLFDFGDVNGVGDVGCSPVRTARAAATLTLTLSGGQVIGERCRQPAP